MKINIIDWIKVGFVLGLFQGYSIMGYAQNTELYKENIGHNTISAQEKVGLVTLVDLSIIRISTICIGGERQNRKI